MKPKKPPFEELENGIHYIFWSCPSKLICDTVMEFIKEYDFLKEFPNVEIPSYNKISPRFKLAKDYFTNKIAEYRTELHLKEMRKKSG